MNRAESCLLNEELTGASKAGKMSASSGWRINYPRKIVGAGGRQVRLRHAFLPCSRRCGGLVLTGKAVDLKSTGPRGSWGFESLALRSSKSGMSGLRILPMRRGGRVVEGARLLSVCRPKGLPWVQIPASPLKSMSAHSSDG
jgi:hypothetical protein